MRKSRIRFYRRVHEENSVSGNPSFNGALKLRAVVKSIFAAAPPLAQTLCKA
jgi:hypothetical protein